MTSEDNPEWQVDLSDDVIGAWKSEAGRGGDVTLVWGLPLVRGAVAATAELDGEVVDQCPVQDGDFTLVAVDAVHGFGDDVYLTVKLWNRRLGEVAAESLYAESDKSRTSRPTGRIGGPRSGCRLGPGQSPNDRRSDVRKRAEIPGRRRPRRRPHARGWTRSSPRSSRRCPVSSPTR